MFAMPMQKIAKRILSVARRTHNMPEDMRRAEIETEIEANWQRVMSKAETYRQGRNILTKGGYFSAVSMGNWHELCRAAGVEMIPGRVVAVIDPVTAFDLMMNGLSDRVMPMLDDITNGIQDIAEDEVLRYDSCASVALKQDITLGRADGNAPKERGWSRNADGVAFPDLPDHRIVQALMEDPQNQSPVWVTKWVPPVMMEGSTHAGLKASAQRHQLYDPEAVIPEGSGTLFPCEWRVFVKNGEVQAIGNYYPMISRGETPEDEAIALAMVGEAKRKTETLIALMRDAGAIPHHPKYEDRDGFDPDGCHFSLDFLEVEDTSRPHGRRLVMLEGGPAHLRNPNWGAHPVSFGVHEEPSGIALSPSDIRPRAALDAL